MYSGSDSRVKNEKGGVLKKKKIQENNLLTILEFVLTLFFYKRYKFKFNKKNTNI